MSDFSLGAQKGLLGVLTVVVFAAIVALAVSIGALGIYLSAKLFSEDLFGVTVSFVNAIGLSIFISVASLCSIDLNNKR